MPALSSRSQLSSLLIPRLTPRPRSPRGVSFCHLPAPALPQDLGIDRSRVKSQQMSSEPLQLRKSSNFVPKGSRCSLGYGRWSSSGTAWHVPSCQRRDFGVNYHEVRTLGCPPASATSSVMAPRLRHPLGRAHFRRGAAAHPAVLFLPNLASPATSPCPRLRLKPAQVAHPEPGGGSSEGRGLLSCRELLGARRQHLPIPQGSEPCVMPAGARGRLLHRATLLHTPRRASPWGCAPSHQHLTGMGEPCSERRSQLPRWMKHR